MEVDTIKRGSRSRLSTLSLRVVGMVKNISLNHKNITMKFTKNILRIPTYDMNSSFWIIDPETRGVYID